MTSFHILLVLNMSGVSDSSGWKIVLQAAVLDAMLARAWWHCDGDSRGCMGLDSAGLGSRPFEFRPLSLSPVVLRGSSNLD